jgi:hypothetical protein
VIAALGGIEKCSILETHSGPGMMRRLCYVGAREILSADEAPESPDAVHVDSRLLLRSSSLDLRRFNFFDIDPFASPFEHMWILAKRRPLSEGERVGLVLTSGNLSSLARLTSQHHGYAAIGMPPAQLAELGGVVDAHPKHYTIENGHRLLMRACMVWFAPARIESWWGMDGSPNKVRYDALVLAR